MKEIIGIAADHAGFELKKALLTVLNQMNINVKDYGVFSTDSVDYPDIVHPLGNDINQGVISKGIVICGSGNGVQITVNKYPNVRCALCWIEEIASLARLHNDANVLSLPARFISNDLAERIVKVFLSTQFEGGRHQIRVEKIQRAFNEKK